MSAPDLHASTGERAATLRAPDKRSGGARASRELAIEGRAGQVEYRIDRSREAAGEPARSLSTTTVSAKAGSGAEPGWVDGSALEYTGWIAGFGGPVNPRAVMWGLAGEHTPAGPSSCDMLWRQAPVIGRV